MRRAFAIDTLGSPWLRSGFIALVLAVIAVGCSQGGEPPLFPRARHGGGTATPGSGTNGPMLAVAAVPGATEAYYRGTDVLVSGFDLQAAGDDLTVAGVTLTASGTADDSTAVSLVRLISDENANGAFDVGVDRVLGQAAGYGADDGTATVGGLSEAVAAGSTLHILVLYDLAGQARPGQTIAAAIAASADLQLASASGQPVSVSGAPAAGADVPVFINTHLLISEIAIKPSPGEFFEIYNPTARPVDLSEYYVSDATDYTSGYWYYNIVTGGDYGDGHTSTYDFHARFPQGATILPDQAIAIAFSSDSFQATYGVAPAYELLQDGAADGVPDLAEVTAGSVGAQAGFSNTEEILVLYRWDGQADLVTDIDYVPWVGNRNSIDKTGIAVDGPDLDTNTSPYLPDYDRLMQDHVLDHMSGFAMRRIDLEEAQEVEAGGNGITGHNEMSENVSIAFDSQARPTPGQP